MFPVLELRRVLFIQAQVGLVHQGGALERVAGTFLLQIVMGDPPELVINEGNHSAQGLLVTSMPTCE